MELYLSSENYWFIFDQMQGILLHFMLRRMGIFGMYGIFLNRFHYLSIWFTFPGSLRKHNFDGTQVSCQRTVDSHLCSLDPSGGLVRQKKQMKQAGKVIGSRILAEALSKPISTIFMKVKMRHLRPPLG